MFVYEQLLKTDIQIPSSFAVNMGTQHMWQNKKSLFFSTDQSLSVWSASTARGRAEKNEPVSLQQQPGLH